MNSLVFAPLLEGTSLKLHTVITYEDSRSAKTTQYVLGHELYRLLASNGGHQFCLYPFGKLIHDHQQKFRAPRRWWESVSYTHLRAHET